jgi:D5 N terminal like
MADADTDNIIRLAELLEPEVLTEHTAALVFTDRYRNELLFDHDRGEWFYWNGIYWQPDKSCLAFDFVHQTVAQLAEMEPKRRRSTEKSAFMSGVEKLARADRAFAMCRPACGQGQRRVFDRCLHCGAVRGW